MSVHIQGGRTLAHGIEPLDEEERRWVRAFQRVLSRCPRQSTAGHVSTE